MFPDHDWQWFPLSNPGIISIPFGFLCGWIGTLLSKEHDEEKYAELEVRAAHRRGRALTDVTRNGWTGAVPIACGDRKASSVRTGSASGSAVGRLAA